MRWRREWKKIEERGTHPSPPCEGGGTCTAEQKVLPHRANEVIENQLNVDSFRNEGSAVPCTTGARRDLGGSLTKLLHHRTPDGRYLVTRKVHWQAVYRVLVDEGWYDASLGYAGFVDYIRSVAPPGGFRIMPDVETIRHISQTLYARPQRRCWG